MKRRRTLALSMATVDRLTGRDPRDTLRAGWVPCADQDLGAAVIGPPPDLAMVPDDHPGWDRLSYNVWEGMR